MERTGNDSFFVLSLGTTRSGADNLWVGLHAAPVTGKDALVAARAHSSAFMRFANSAGVTTIKEKLCEAI